MLQEYLKDIFNTHKRGDAREESYYSTLEKLITNFISKKNKKFEVTVLPKKTEGGNPDFRVWDGKQKIVGYIEAKSLETDNLDEIENSEQLKRYYEAFPNLILTNFFEFRLYRKGELIKKVTVGRFFLIDKLETIPPAENEADFLNLLEQFFSFSIPKINTAKQLAIELATRTKFLRGQLIDELSKEEKQEGTQTLEGFYKSFKDYLLSSLEVNQFADLFAQTITYGLFVARSRSEGVFTRETASKYIPSTIGILKKVFQFVSAPDLPISMKIIDDITEVLAATNVKNIIHRFYHENKGSDPIIHFYETFLSKYDPKERAKRGVYYTPEPVVSYIVKSIDKLLKEKLDKKDGLADSSVTILDPASGTLTFPAKAISQAVENYKNNYGQGGISSLIKDHILKNFYAFELMMAPYAVGHLKISLLLDELGYKMGENERFKLYLTNTLEMKDFPHSDLPLYIDIADESNKASVVKKKEKIMVVFGNPPYSVSSSNKIEKDSELYPLYESYKETVRKEERNIQPLSDDYIKFIAFAHYKVKQAGAGIVGMITNNSYLDGIIHRDMRRKLMEEFNQIYILNLHGSSKRKEKTPAGGKDENVFDIQQGVSIILMVKGQKLIKYVKYFDLWGLREEKYKFLDTHDVKNTHFELLTPKEKYYFFVKKDLKTGNEYEKFISLKDIFEKYNAGIATGKDDILVDFDKENLLRKLSIKDKELFRLTMEQEEISKELIDAWWKELQSINIKEQIKSYYYRPFDIRYTIYNKKILQRARMDLMNNLLTKNIALCTIKQYKKSSGFSLISNNITCRDLITNHTYIFPLYIYYEQTKDELFLNKNPKSSNYKWSNLPNFIQTLQPFTSQLSNNYIQPVEGIFYYIYAVLYSNIYRQKYQEFLKIDFPKIPFTNDWDLFKIVTSLGEELANLHLLKSKSLDYPSAKIYGHGEGQVEKIEHRDKKVFINGTQYFYPVEENVYNYFIGGYQVLNKWLKDRKGKTMSSDDIKHYCKVVTSLKLTIEIQERIDKFYLKIEKDLI